jgi:hypothetical protein
MPNQDVGAYPDQLPKDEHHDEVVRQDNAEHRKHEERQAGEIAGPASVVVHVADRIDVDQETDAGDHQQHHFAEPVDQVADANLENSEIDPIKTDVLIGAAKYGQTEKKRNGDRRYRHVRTKFLQRLSRDHDHSRS